MNLYAIIFYVLAFIILASTALAVTRRNLMHAIVYLVLSFFGTALLFYLLGAPFLAVLEVIIYAGAIMVLFLFIVMMLEIRSPEEPVRSYLLRWLPAAVMGALSLAAAGILLVFKSGRSLPLPLSAASPLEFGRFLFQRYWFSVEIVSYLLFVALVGALYLGRKEG
ncbi:MAG: NADH-quinone oxidoreductase subunit J [Deltaproteobacteria bacterium]|nr:NADH-quinone oxidoreductase subunit J [Deltaproteobacteria bacterium]